jgi:hypothetical protein
MNELYKLYGRAVGRSRERKPWLNENKPQGEGRDVGRFIPKWTGAALRQAHHNAIRLYFWLSIDECRFTNDSSEWREGMAAAGSTRLATGRGVVIKCTLPNDGRCFLVVNGGLFTSLGKGECR